MKTAALRGGGATKHGITAEQPKATTRAAALQVDLPGLRTRLVGARRRLVERIAEDWTDDRRFPDSGWTKMLGDVQAAINAVDDVVAEDGP